MAKNPPVVYLLYGEDDQAIAEFLATIRSKLGEASIADMNTTRMEAKGLSLPSLKSSCLVAPFLAKRRLVIVDGYISALASRGPKKDEETGEEPEEESTTATETKKALLSFFEEIPPTTALVFVEKRSLPATNFFLKWAGSHEELAFVRECIPPKGAALTEWILKRAQSEGGKFTSAGAQMLGALVGEDPRTLAQEIVKLITYAGERPVTADDVSALTPESAQTNIFDMVDAVGGRDNQKAMRLLRKTVEQSSAPAVFGMLVRQFRLLLLAREALDSGVPQNGLASAIGQHPFVAQKLALQARRFTLSSLEAIFRRLRDMDEEVKTGRMELDTAMEMLVTQLA